MLYVCVCVCTAVVAPGNSAVFHHRVEALLEGKEVFSKTATVEVSRKNSDTLLVLVTNDEQDAASSAVSHHSHRIIFVTFYMNNNEKKQESDCVTGCSVGGGIIISLTEAFSTVY